MYGCFESIDFLCIPHLETTLNWLWQEEITAIPKSVHKERIEQNFAITEEEKKKIEAMDDGKHLILDIFAMRNGMKRGHHPNAQGNFTSTSNLAMMNYPLQSLKR